MATKKQPSAGWNWSRCGEPIERLSSQRVIVYCCKITRNQINIALYVRPQSIHRNHVTLSLLPVENIPVTIFLKVLTVSVIFRNFTTVLSQFLGYLKNIFTIFATQSPPPVTIYQGNSEFVQKNSVELRFFFVFDKIRKEKVQGTSKVLRILLLVLGVRIFQKNTFYF